MNADLEYKRLLELVLTKGRRKKNRTGIDTFGVFGAQARFDLSDGFPLLTTKKMFFKGIVHELLWFIRGDTNIKYLVDNGVNIWNANAFARYQKNCKGSELCYSNIEDYVNAIRDARPDQSPEDELFVESAAELGDGTYGQMWRDFPVRVREANGTMTYGVDQLYNVVEKLKTNPDDRRIIVSAWHPYYVDTCALPPCHVLQHYNTEELEQGERWKLYLKSHNAPESFGTSTTGIPLEWDSDQIAALLTEAKIPTRRLNCLLYQRSCDLFLGVPFNIASYALLTSLVAESVGMVPGEFIHTYGDLHLYENHLAQAREQLARAPFALPKIQINPNKDLFSLKYEDVSLVGYQSHPALKAEMAV